MRARYRSRDFLDPLPAGYERRPQIGAGLVPPAIQTRQPLTGARKAEIVRRAARGELVGSLAWEYGTNVVAIRKLIGEVPA